MNNHIKKRAFTLVELLMVIGIISIMMILLIPSINPIKTEVKNLSLTKNKENLEGLVQTKASRLSMRGLEGDELFNEVGKELLEEPSIINMTNPFDTSKKGIGLILGNSYDNTDKAVYLFTEDPLLETLPKGTISLRINPEELVFNNRPTSPPIQTTPTMFSSPLSGSTILSNNKNTYVLGLNTSGQLGVGDQVNKSTPTLITLPNNVKPKSIVTGFYHSLAIGTDGNLYAWGNNQHGQLGIGDTTDRLTPTLINLPNGVKPISTAVGAVHSIAIGDDGNLYTWGYNNSNQLGDGTTTDKITPTLITLPNNIKPITISAGFYHSLAIGTDGKLYSWGNNSFGQLGDGSITTRSIPILIKLPNNTDPKLISCGYYHSIVVGSDGNLYTWGDNGYGQLGNGTINAKTAPTLITLPNNIKPKSILAGGNHSLVIGDDENLYSWGYNKYGQLGDGTTVNKTNPTLIKLPNNIKLKSISAGSGHSLALGTDGTLYSWGYNYFGQLGTGDTIDRTTPTLVNPFDLIK